MLNIITIVALLITFKCAVTTAIVLTIATVVAKLIHLVLRSGDP